jgi:hypothetical protein
MSTEYYGEAYIVEPVKRAPQVGAGRKAEANPFHVDVRGVIGQVTEDGRPLTIGRTFALDAVQGETLKQRHDRIRRFLTRAGKEHAKADGAPLPYMIGLAIDALPNEGGIPATQRYVVKFWDKRARKA